MHRLAAHGCSQQLRCSSQAGCSVTCQGVSTDGDSSGSGPTVHWRNAQGQLVRYPRDVTQDILRQAVKGAKLATVPITTVAYPEGHWYTVDFRRMVQRNNETGRERDVAIEISPSPLAVLAMALAASSKTKRKVVPAWAPRMTHSIT